MDVNNFSFEKVEIKVENYDEDPLDNDTADGYECQKIEESSIDVDKVKIEPVYLTIPHENIYVEPEFIKVEVENLDKPETSSSLINGYKIKEETPTIECDNLSSYLFKCDLCRKEFIKKSTLRYHMRLHIEEKPYSSSEYPANKSKNKPPIIQKRAKPYACSECPSRFRAKRTLDAHILLHTGERPYLCTLCPATFRVPHNLKHHMKSHCKDKRFSCSVCSKTFREQSLVTDHMKIHSEEDKSISYEICSCKTSHTDNKPIACELCPYKFRTNGDLKYHMRIHTGEKPFQCDECSAKFCRKSQLAEHKRTHSGEKPFQCKTCSFKCARKSQLNYHVKNYHKKESYSCKDCPSKFDDVVALKIHAGHHKKVQVEVFQCGICSKTYVAKNNYTRHIKSHALK
ncbi:zinc finger protein 454-like isoform X2 [Cotesia glomerata]|uniref:zinc finger protein 454-like isoform X2 n=1 Tax=Cotesia glomerata TaxID=32391 RepID=UPI001D01D98E|nr:zinc finger protein 454-like isoform X2 [Cotesia glomerata]